MQASLRVRFVFTTMSVPLGQTTPSKLTEKIHSGQSTEQTTSLTSLTDNAQPIDHQSLRIPKGNLGWR